MTPELVEQLIVGGFVALGGVVTAYLAAGYSSARSEIRAAAERLRRQQDRITHVFLDIETLGIAHDAPVLVVAACVVDSRGREVKAGQWRIHEASARHWGTSCAATEQWWSEQSPEAIHSAFQATPRVDHGTAMRAFAAFVAEIGGEVWVWGNAPTFDCSILRHALEQAETTVPWAFWQERDCRTVAALGKGAGSDSKANTPFEGTPHDALDDARHQAKYTMKALRHRGSEA